MFMGIAPNREHHGTGRRLVHVSESELKYLDLHGDRVAYREAGTGDALLLIQGMAGSSATWQAVLPELSVFSLVPRCHGLFGSAKYTLTPEAIENWA
jgi:hypothetical protein